MSRIVLTDRRGNVVEQGAVCRKETEVDRMLSRMADKLTREMFHPGPVVLTIHGQPVERAVLSSGLGAWLPYSVTG